MYIDGLLYYRKFKEINELIKEKKISLRDLLFDSVPILAILAENLSALENVNIDDLIDVICKTKSAEWICIFAEYAVGLTQTQINTLADAVINKMESIDALLFFAERVKNAPIAKLGKIINESNNASIIFSFLKNVPNIPNDLMDDFARNLVAMKKGREIQGFLYCADGIFDSTYKILIEGLVEMGSVDDILNFVTVAWIYCQVIIPDDYLKILVKPIIKTKNLEKILGFASVIKYANDKQLWEDLTDAIILLLSKKMENIYEFAIDFKKANKAKIASVLIESKSFKWVYKFAKNVKNIPEDVMQSIVSFVARTNSPEFIYMFLSNIELSMDNTKVLVCAIMNTENIEFIGYSLLNVGNKYLQGNLQTEERTKELEEKLLTSDDEVLNPFIPDAIYEMQKTYYL